MRRFFVLILWTVVLMGSLICTALDIHNLLPLLAGITLALVGAWYVFETALEEKRAKINETEEDQEPGQEPSRQW